MRRIIFGFVLVGIAVSAVAQMLRQPSAESDALFAAGVDLYNKGKYREAIPLFAKSDSLDKAQIDSTSNRRVYSSMWLASCYYKMGDTATAAGIDANYRFAPVDRSLTVKSDSLSQIGMEYFNQGDYAKAVEYLTQCAEIEKSVLGDKHIFYGNSVHSIANSYAAMNDTTALKYNKLYVDIARHFYGEQSNEDIIVTANTGIMFHKFALYDRALRCFIDAYNYADSLNPNKQDLAYLVANEYKTIALSNSINDALDNLLNARLYLEKADSSSSDVKTLHLSVEKSIAYISIKATPETDILAARAVQSIMRYLPEVLQNGDNKTARQKMAQAALDAGICINNSSVTVIHGMSRPIGAMFHVPHGLSNAMLLPTCLADMADAAAQRFAALARNAGFATADDTDAEAARILVIETCRLCDLCNVPTLGEYGIDEAQYMQVIDKMAADAIASGSPGNAPKAYTAADCRRLYIEAYNRK